MKAQGGGGYRVCNLGNRSKRLQLTPDQVIASRNSQQSLPRAQRPRTVVITLKSNQHSVPGC
jgi:hypothetical protein